MPTLLLKLIGPMQSWGITSRFDQRDTFREPSKSGVIGLVCCAMGIDRWDFNRQSPLYNLRMGVRNDRPGILRYDYQTAACGSKDVIARADGTPASKGGVVSRRSYLADASFLVGLETDNIGLLNEIQEALSTPVWPLCLGRKSYVPSEPIACEFQPTDYALEEALLKYPLLRSSEASSTSTLIQFSFESSDCNGLFIMDQPVGPLGQRHFSSRYIVTKNIRIDEVSICTSTE